MAMMAAAALVAGTPVSAQRIIKDPHITAQEERMVFKRWGNFMPYPTYKKTWTPFGWIKTGIQTNWHYTMTWGNGAWLSGKGGKSKYQGYLNGPDMRPLGPIGPQTQRMALNTILQETSSAHKKHSDSLRNAALSEYANNSGLLSGIDPLWLLYYRRELRKLIDYSQGSAADGLSEREKQYLSETGVTDWFDDEMMRMQERLDAAHGADMDRGGRVLAYHRILKEYRNVLGKWNTQIEWAETLLDMRDSQNGTKTVESAAFAARSARNEGELMDRIINEAANIR